MTIEMVSIVIHLIALVLIKYIFDENLAIVSTSISFVCGSIFGIGYRLSRIESKLEASSLINKRLGKKEQEILTHND